MRHARVAFLSALSALAFCLPAYAESPDPRYSTCDAVVVGNTSGIAIGGTPAGFDAVIKDVTNAPRPGVIVRLDFSPTSIRLVSVQNAGITLDCAARTVSQVTNANGAVNLAVRFGGFVSTNSVYVSHDGVEFATVKARSTDLDGVDGKTGLADLALFSANVLANPAAQETDFDLNGTTGLGDLRIFADEYLRTDPAQSYCP